MLRRRHSGFYPGMLSNILDVNSLSYFYPIEDFVNAHLESRIQDKRHGKESMGCILFNDAIDDDHFSAAGSAVWAPRWATGSSCSSRTKASSTVLSVRRTYSGSTPHQNKAPAATIAPASPRLNRQPRSGP